MMFNKKNNRTISKTLAFLMIVIAAMLFMPFNVIPMVSAEATETSETDNINNLAYEAVKSSYDVYMSGTAVDGGGYTTFSSYDAYVLMKSGVDISKWIYDGESFTERVIKLIDASITNENTALQSSAKRVAQDFLAAKIMGEDEKAFLLLNILKERQTETGELDSGLYSMYSNLPAYDLLTREVGFNESGLNADNALIYVFSNKDETGAYPKENADLWIMNDFMATAQAVRILDATEKSIAVTSSSAIQAAITDGVTWLRNNQQEDGSFIAGWDDALTDTSEMIYTAKVLGEDISQWVSASGNSPLDYLINSAFVDGTFGNISSTTWALDAYLQLGAYVSSDSVIGVKNDNIVVNSFKVKVVVIGKDGEVIYGPKSVSVLSNDEFKGTAMSALDATGLDWEFDGTYGFVEVIDGQRNSGNNGWMYAVNGRVPNVSAINKTVNSGDEVLWWYSTSAMEGAPEWPSSAAAASAAIAVKNEETIEMLESYSNKIKAENTVLNLNNKMTAARAQKIVEELSKNKSLFSLEYKGETTVYDDGEISILLNEDVLDKNTTITAKELDENYNPKQFAVNINSSVYEFGPDGTKFNSPVTISIKVALDDNTDIERLTAAYFDEENNKWVTIPCVIDAESGLVVFRTDHFTKFAVIEKEKRVNFEDVGDSISWAKDAIEILAGKEIINGTGNGFEPHRAITRAEFIKIITDALGYTGESSTGSTFSDVDKSQWFAVYVERAYSNNLIKGDADGKFRPNDSISRYEIAVILNRLDVNKESLGNFSLSFEDASNVPDWAYEGVGFAVMEKLMNGYEDNTFKGLKPMTRAEVATVTFRYLNLSK